MKLFETNATAHLTGLAQIALSILFCGGYFWILSMFLLGSIRTPAPWKDVLTALISLLTAGVLQILQFWFSRERSKDTPPQI